MYGANGVDYSFPARFSSRTLLMSDKSGKIVGTAVLIVLGFWFAPVAGLFLELVAELIAKSFYAIAVIALIGGGLVCCVFVLRIVVLGICRIGRVRSFKFTPGSVSMKRKHWVLLKDVFQIAALLALSFFLLSLLGR